MAEQQQEAKHEDGSERTELAAERTVLANERTYSAWLRTGLTALVSGLAALRFMHEVLGNWAVLTIAEALFGIAVFSFIAGAWRYVHIGRSLNQAQIARLASWKAILASVLLSATAIIAAGGALLLW